MVDLDTVKYSKEVEQDPEKKVRESMQALRMEEYCKKKLIMAKERLRRQKEFLMRKSRSTKR